MPAGYTTPLETRLAAVATYLFSDKTISEIARKYKTSGGNIRSWYKDEKILEGIAKMSGKSKDDVIYVRNGRIEDSKGLRFESKLAAVATYLFSDKSSKKISKKYKTSQGVMKEWYRNDKILEEITRRSGKTRNDIERIRDMKIENSIGFPLES